MWEVISETAVTVSGFSNFKTCFQVNCPSLRALFLSVQRKAQFWCHVDCYPFKESLLILGWSIGRRLQSELLSWHWHQRGLSSEAESRGRQNPGNLQAQLLPVVVTQWCVWELFLFSLDFRFGSKIAGQSWKGPVENHSFYWQRKASRQIWNSQKITHVGFSSNCRAQGINGNTKYLKRYHFFPVPNLKCHSFWKYCKISMILA